MMAEDSLNLFDFGTNESGEYVNLVEEEKKLNDIKEQDFQEWLRNHDNPLVRVAYDILCPYNKLEKYTYNELKDELEWIAAQKVYHYGNTGKDLYIYTIFQGDCWCFVFETLNHIMLNLNYSYSQKEVEQYLKGKKTIHFNALSVRVYDNNGNRIDEYADQDHYKEDIRHRVCINEWQMDKYGDNRMKEGKKIKDFYEIGLLFPKLIDYWGESNVE